jgi:glutamate synthase (NADPH/NADH) small chain
VVFKLGFEVGRDATLEDLRDKHDAVLIAVGVYAARDLIAPGAGSRGVVPALDYLIASNKKTLGDDVPAYDSGELNAEGKDVVVVGGGDTAMDCVRTAIRQGATSVTCLYRRDKANMPGSLREVANAEEEGVTFEWLAAPRAVMGEAEASPAFAPSACAWAPRTRRAARAPRRSKAAISIVRPSWWSRPWASSPRTCPRPGRPPI